MPHAPRFAHTLRRAPSLRRALAAALALAAGACAPRTAPAQSSAPAPKPAQAVAAMELSGQKVLVLPVQAVAGIPQSREDATRELLFALGERDTRTQWLDPERLRSALRRTPGYADDPDALPAESFLHHRERYMQGALGSLVRRYSALMDTRLVLIPQAAQWLPAADGTGGGVIRLSAVMVDARSSNVVWYGEADGQRRPEADAAALATAAAALAQAMVVSR
ncbi:MAG TPA: hypothetical protein VFJ82_05660 [Longimicrobium sp.]|nr:hypothetical protein [Longimicrobium sp.]